MALSVLGVLGAELERLGALGVAALASTSGLAGSAREAGPYTMPALADAVVALLDARKLSQIVLVGGSMGGVVAAHLVLRPRNASLAAARRTGAATAIRRALARRFSGAGRDRGHRDAGRRRILLQRAHAQALVKYRAIG